MDARTILIQDDLIKNVIQKLSTIRGSQKEYDGIVLWTINDDINQIIKQQFLSLNMKIFIRKFLQKIKNK